MIEEYRRTKDSELKIIMNAFGIMAVAGVLSLCMYWKLEIPFYGTIFEVGVLIFEQLLLTSIFVNLVEQAKTRSELEVYERLLKEDRMTGINNRTAFEEQLQDIEDHAQDYDNAALIFMDVDGLKNTNDLYGHDMGDSAIKEIASIILKVISKEDIAIRYGGDEFVIITNYSSKDLSTKITDEVFSFLNTHIPQVIIKIRNDSLNFFGFYV